jgi:hypothetical protein
MLIGGNDDDCLRSNWLGSWRDLLQVGVGFAAQVEWHLAVHVSHHLPQIAHVDEGAADRAIAEVLDLGPLGHASYFVSESSFDSPESSSGAINTGGSSYPSRLL